MRFGRNVGEKRHQNSLDSEDIVHRMVKRDGGMKRAKEARRNRFLQLAKQLPHEMHKPSCFILNVQSLFPISAPFSALQSGLPVGCWLRAGPLPRKLFPQEGADEARLSHAVLPNDQHHRLGIEL